jgi:hypothetical protein
MPDYVGMQRPYLDQLRLVILGGLIDADNDGLLRELERAYHH